MHRNDQWDDLSRFKEAVEQTRALYESAKMEFTDASKHSSKRPWKISPDVLLHRVRVHDSLMLNYNRALVEFNRRLIERISEHLTKTKSVIERRREIHRIG